MRYNLERIVRRFPLGSLQFAPEWGRIIVMGYFQRRPTWIDGHYKIYNYGVRGLTIDCSCESCIQGIPQQIYWDEFV